MLLKSAIKEWQQLNELGGHCKYSGEWNKTLYQGVSEEKKMDVNTVNW